MSPSPWHDGYLPARPATLAVHVYGNLAGKPPPIESGSYGRTGNSSSGRRLDSAKWLLWISLYSGLGIFLPSDYDAGLGEPAQQRFAAALRQVFQHGELGLVGLMLAISVIWDLQKSRFTSYTIALGSVFLAMSGIMAGAVWVEAYCRRCTGIRFTSERAWRDSRNLALLVFSLALVTEILLDRFSKVAGSMSAAATALSEGTTPHSGHATCRSGGHAGLCVVDVCAAAGAVSRIVPAVIIQNWQSARLTPIMILFTVSLNLGLYLTITYQRSARPGVVASACLGSVPVFVLAILNLVLQATITHTFSGNIPNAPARVDEEILAQTYFALVAAIFAPFLLIRLGQQFYKSER